MKIKKKMGGVRSGRGWGGGGGRVGLVRVDVNEDLKFLRKFTNKSGGVGGSGGGVGLVGGQGGCERNVGGRGLCGVWGM